MGSQKAVLVDFRCINEPFDFSDASLIDFVMSRNKEFSARIRDQFGLLTSELGLRERSLTAYLMGYLKWPDSLTKDLSKVPASIRPSDDEYLSTMGLLNKKVEQARESRSYLHQFHDDFPIAASEWINRGFKCVIYSEVYSEHEILDIVKRAELQGDVIAAKVPYNENNEWIEALANDLELDLPSSFLIAAHVFGMREARNQFGIKVAILDRMFVAEPWEERGYYLNIGSLLDIDPEPSGVDIGVKVSEETSLSAFLRKGRNSKRPR